MAALAYGFAASTSIAADPPPDQELVAAAQLENPSDPIAGREHWAFRPLAVPSQVAPVVKATDWPRSAIDAFVLAKLEAANLAPAADADRRTLIRRVYFQLIDCCRHRDK